MFRVIASAPENREGWSSFLVWGTASVFFAVFLYLISNLFWNGITEISWEFITQAPRNAGRDGGIFPIIVSTLWILLVCMAVTLPLGIGTAVFLSEFVSNDNVSANLMRRSLDVLAGVPSIVIGLFGNTLFCIKLGLGFSILSGGLTLACMVLPIFIRTVEEGIKNISPDHRLNAYALGISKASLLWNILLPLAAPAIVAAFVLGVGRALAETAALIFTSGYVDRMPESLLDSGRALSIHIFDLSMNVPGGDKRAYAAALVLVILLLIINSTAHWMKNYFINTRIAGQ